MKKARVKDARLERVSKICNAFPKSIREVLGSHASFTVSGKTYAYYLNNHHGDGIVAVACKVLPGDNEALIAAHPEKFYFPAYIGPRGWVGLRLDIAGVDWEEAAELIAGSYRLIAPKRLVAMLKRA
jgi:phosphoribosylglycinamide formyltransferase-1